MPLVTSLTWTAAEQLADAVLVVPIGATEQHGPHLPLSTDSDIATALADRLVTAHPQDVVIAPLIAFGSSGEHQDFAGTLSVGQDALELFLVELGRSATCTWQRIVFLSTHGGNRQPVRRAAHQLQREGRGVRVWAPAWGGDHHAGRTETSLMLAIAPDRVDTSAAQPGATGPLTTLLPRLTQDGIAAVSENGVLGDPAGASAGEGERLLANACDSLSELITRWPAEEVLDGVA
jgi:mycofactocin precursor peptide peptidase